MYDLIGRTILITGASSGIGMSIARFCAREGARILICARRKDRLETLAEELREAHSAEVHLFGVDVRDRAQVEVAFAHLPHEWRDIDVLINNAGLSRGMDSVQEGDPEDWEDMIQTNISGLLNVTRQVLPGMVRRRKGDIVNLGSISSHEVYPKGAVYCATKHAVDALTKGLRMDLVHTPIRVSQISPGMTNTEFSVVRFHGDQDRAAQVYQGLTPLSADDVADAALFILTRPAHVQIGEIVLWPTSQGSTTLAHRVSENDVSVPPNESTWRSHYDLS